MALESKVLQHMEKKLSTSIRFLLPCSLLDHATRPYPTPHGPRLQVLQPDAPAPGSAPCVIHVSKSFLHSELDPSGWMTPNLEAYTMESKPSKELHLTIDTAEWIVPSCSITFNNIYPHREAPRINTYQLLTFTSGLARPLQLHIAGPSWNASRWRQEAYACLLDRELTSL